MRHFIKKNVKSGRLQRPERLNFFVAKTLQVRGSHPSKTAKGGAPDTRL
jgi:hypothetical protein